MDHWNLAIDRNRKALVAIAASLSGLVCSPRNRRYVSRVLRAAEAALRRLIVMYMKAHNITARAPKPCNRPLPDFSSFGSGSNKRAPVFKPARKAPCVEQRHVRALTQLRARRMPRIANRDQSFEGRQTAHDPPHQPNRSGQTLL